MGGLHMSFLAAFMRRARRFRSKRSTASSDGMGGGLDCWGFVGADGWCFRKEVDVSVGFLPHMNMLGCGVV